MSPVSYDIFISDIDKERFGIKTARIIGLTADSLPSILDFCGREKVALLIARCNMADLSAAQAMEKEGFLLMDTLVYYSLDLARQSVPADNGVARVRTIRIDEEEEMISVARESFRGYFGHYHADPRLDKSKCDEAYADWARKAFASRNSENFLAGEIGGKIISFGVLRINNPDEGEMFLGGIHPNFQGQGIYHSFLCKAMEWCLSKNAKKMIISTQLKNIPVQKVLIKFGFEISSGYYTYHKWFY
ncbi:MAG: GNAT family N-acetyltransferase [Deltaproteobacteria bacterium]|nr:GNAT family N-acetyltransferase [Deltaproteobacteria bacterium]